MVFLGLEVVFCAGAVEFVLLALEFALECVDVVVELAHSLAVGVAVSEQFVGEGVDAFVEFLAISCCLGLLQVQLILEGVDFCPEGELSLLFLDLLILLVPDQILDLLVLLPHYPVQFVDLCDQCLDLLDMSTHEVIRVFFLDVLVLDLDVDHLASVVLLEREDLVTQAVVFLLEDAHLLLMAIPECLIVCELIFELVVLVIVGCFELADFLLQQEDLVGIILLEGLYFYVLLVAVLLLGVL